MTKDNLIDKLDEIGMLYFVIVSLFSAETLVDVESCEVSLKGIEMLRAELPTSKYKDDPEIKKLIDGAEEIIRRDLEEFKKEQLDASRILESFFHPTGYQRQYHILKRGIVKSHRKLHLAHGRRQMLSAIHWQPKPCCILRNIL